MLCRSALCFSDDLIDFLCFLDHFKARDFWLVPSAPCVAVPPLLFKRIESNRAALVRFLLKRDILQRADVQRFELPSEQVRNDNDPLVGYAVKGLVPFPGVEKEPSKDHIESHRHKRNAPDDPKPFR